MVGTRCVDANQLESLRAVGFSSTWREFRALEFHELVCFSQPSGPWQPVIRNLGFPPQSSVLPNCRIKMPNILLFFCCEKVINDSEQNVPTAVSIFRKINYSTPENANSGIVVIPNAWTAFAFWERLPGEEAREFEQQVQWVSPTDQVLIGAVQAISTKAETTRNICRFVGMPVSESGDYKCTLSIREIGQSAEWTLVSSWKIVVGTMTDPTAVPA